MGRTFWDISSGSFQPEKPKQLRQLPVFKIEPKPLTWL
jgi:hypothetical protein